MTMPWDLIGNVVDKIVPDKSERDAMKIRLMELRQNGEFRDLELRYNAIVMEAQSKHMAVALARPAFLYVIYVYLLFAIPFGFMAAFSPELSVNVSAGMGAWLNAIPEEMWLLFGAGYLGYVKKRSDDKETVLNPTKEKSFLQKLF